MTSHEASSFFENETLDFVFIDGDHSYQGVLSDIQDYLPKIKKGGYISGHDTQSEDVLRAIYDSFPKEDVKLILQNCWNIKIK